MGKASSHAGCRWLPASRHAAVRAIALGAVLAAVFSAPSSALAQALPMQCGMDPTAALDAVPLDPQVMLEALVTAPDVSASGTSIVINAGPALRANPQALAAFERAAARWEAVLMDPVQINIDADFATLSSTTTIASTRARQFSLSFDLVRLLLVEDVAAEPADAVTLALPASDLPVSVPPGLAYGGNLVSSKANLKALGFDLDTLQGPSDGTITFNTAFLPSFDFDNRDGVGATLFDFETAATHEIGHFLGFLSGVDANEQISDDSSAIVQPLDLYRFPDLSGSSPESLTEFTQLSRTVASTRGVVFDDVPHDIPLAPGRSVDGTQASHWKDDFALGFTIGVMDPTLRRGQSIPISAADRRALDLIGWDVLAAEAPPSVSIPGPLRVASGSPIQLPAQVSDGDGLGFPVFAAFGIAARVSFLWDFAPATGSAPLAALARQPVVTYTLAPGGATTVFNPSLTAVDALGDVTTRSVDVIVSEPPMVVVLANGSEVDVIRVRSGARVTFSATASDADGLGFPIFAGFGFANPITFLWSFGGGQPANPLQIFVAAPQVTFSGTPGQVFTVALQVFDAVGIATERRIRVELMP